MILATYIELPSPSLRLKGVKLVSFRIAAATKSGTETGLLPPIVYCQLARPLLPWLTSARANPSPPTMVTPLIFDSFVITANNVKVPL